MRAPSFRRRAVTFAGIAVAAGVIILAVVAGTASSSDESTSTTDTTSVPVDRTAEVQVRDLVRTIEVDGTLGYGDPRPVQSGPNSPGGTITRLPEPGTVIGIDQALYDIDGRAGPILLAGTLPMWRPLDESVTDGPDVSQLEQNLVDLGYSSSLTVDGHFTAATKEAIGRWQEAHGLEVTGRINPGDVWFADGAVRVASTHVELGAPAQGDIMTVTSTDRRVHVDMEPRHVQHAVEGVTVDVELADGTMTTGTVTDVADAATVSPGQGSDAPTTTVAVEITLTDDVEAFDESPVTVTFVTDEVADALAVPVEAVVAKPDGTYALEVLNEDGSTRLVDVELGRFADGWVQVTGDIQAGDTVVTA